MFTSELSQSIYNDIKTYNDHTVEQLKQSLEKAYEVLTEYTEEPTAIAYIEAVEKYLKESLH